MTRMKSALTFVLIFSASLLAQTATQTPSKSSTENFMAKKTAPAKAGTAMGNSTKASSAKVIHDSALMGIEGGHSIENDLGLLRDYYKLGVRYMTLTWSNTNEWADSSGDENDPNVTHYKGMTVFGREVVREMNRLGMMVDISHVSDRTFYQTLTVSRAPVIASHSSARAITNVPRNMTDDMLRAITLN